MEQEDIAEHTDVADDVPVVVEVANVDYSAAKGSLETVAESIEEHSYFQYIQHQQHQGSRREQAGVH